MQTAATVPPVCSTQYHGLIKKLFYEPQAFSGVSSEDLLSGCVCFFDAPSQSSLPPSSARRTRTHPSPTSSPATPQFCSSKPVLSLMAQGQTGVKFCQSILQLPTMTHTTTIASVPPPQTLTETLISTKVITQITTTPSISLVTHSASVNVTVPGTYCGNGYTKYTKRGVVIPEPTPTYLGGKSPAYLTSACKCISDIPQPTFVSTVTSGQSASMVTIQSVQVVTSDVSEVLTTGVVDEVVNVTQTRTLYEPTATGLIDKGVDYTDEVTYYSSQASLYITRYFHWGRWDNMTLVTTNDTKILTIPCDGNYYNSQTCAPPGSTNCMQLCVLYNVKNGDDCIGVTYNATTNECSLYGGVVSRPLLMVESDCVVNATHDGSYVAGLTPAFY
ncbi:hypothetical protein ANO11243_091910 [Dothideomycetidae sp. 11243]|nr:hypothetical protein ANO11243_091910 [fungal sp. No.11243]